MKYIIVHLIRGDAKDAHEAITKDLVEKFDCFPIHDRIVPHLTLKRWFEIDEKGMSAIYKTLEDFTATHHQSDYQLKGSGHFGEDVIYVDVQPSAETLSSVKDLMDRLHKIPDLQFDEYDDIEGDLHATVVMRALKPFDFDELWKYIQTIVQPDFRMKFDNVAILRREADKWVPLKVWEIVN